jgi:DNA-binding transcriptional ArsR family regulator
MEDSYKYLIALHNTGPMAKNGSTKGKIIRMIGEKNKTLSDISRELGLAPSTVSQHLQELKEMGAVKEVENEHIKKWKYYSLNPEFDYASFGMEEKNNGASLVGKIPNRVFFYAIGICLALALVYFLAYGINSNVQKSSFVPIKLTDPPIVPNDTQALYMNYSSVSIHTVGSGGPEWIQLNASGSVDLMSLVNVSEVIAGAEVAHNAKIDAIRFDVNSASIVINGTTYSVIVPNGQISAQISGNKDVNASSEVLVDFSPTVLAMYINGTTEFVMVPSVKAVLSMNHGSVGSANRVPVVGQRLRLSDHEMEGLYNSGNLSITGTSLDTYANGTTRLSITVKNSGKTALGLSDVLILGNQTPVTRLNITCGGSYAEGSEIAQWCSRIESAGLNASEVLGNRSNLERIIQTPVAAGGPTDAYRRPSFDVLQRIVYSRGIDFLIQSSGNLTLAYGDHGMSAQLNYSYDSAPFNYTLGPGQSANLTFEGPLSLSGGLEIALVNSSDYRVAVLGRSGIHTLERVTAG